MNFVQVVTHETCTQKYSSEPYGDWYSNCDTTVLGLKPSKQYDYNSIPVDFDLVPDMPLYLVYVVYSTGDSFGRSDGRTDFVDVLDNSVDADFLVKVINDRSLTRNNSYSVTITYPSNGRKFLLSPSWEGYFETIESVNVEIFQLGRFEKRKVE